MYKKRIERAYDKHVIQRKLKAGDLMLKPITKSQLPPHVIKVVYYGNAYRLVNVEGEELPYP